MIYMNNTDTRTANHFLVTNSGTVHAAADSRFRGHVIACTGRTMSGAVLWLSDSGVTCKACRAGIASGRIEWTGK